MHFSCQLRPEVFCTLVRGAASIFHRRQV